MLMIHEETPENHSHSWKNAEPHIGLVEEGCFDEAMRLLEEMPIQPNVDIWGALLNGCILRGSEIFW
ncbi:unnamed protein product [Malus baccata var. baccata]